MCDGDQKTAGNSSRCTQDFTAMAGQLDQGQNVYVDLSTALSNLLWNLDHTHQSVILQPASILLPA